jgi:hypothetical protein
MKWIRRLSSWFRTLLDSKVSYTHVWSEDPPDEPKQGFVYLIGDRPTPWSAAFICPCGCKELISLSLVPRDSPRWRYHVSAQDPISLSPSIWRTKGCKSHFFIKNGRVLWALETDRTPRARPSGKGG